MIGELIGAGLGIAGKLFGAKQDKKHADQQFEKNGALQREFAQNGVKWRVDDAHRSGIHPAFALGANLQSASPVSVGSTSMADVMGSVGQDIGRAVSATQNQSERMGGAFARHVQALTLEKMGLENQLLRSQIIRANTPSNPPFPSFNNDYLIEGQGQTQSVSGSPSGVPGLVTDKPLERTSSSPTRPSQEPGAVTDVGYVRTAHGWYPAPSKDAKERIEDMWLPERAWEMRNMISPMFGQGVNPPPFMRNGRGKIISFHPIWGYMEIPDPRYSGTGRIGAMSPGRRLHR